ncbi:hypothetical protein B0H13DRAFT_1463298, partial [Mycena leptocephala]
EAEKGKLKLRAFDAALVIPDFFGPRASNFAKKKLDDKKYVDSGTEPKRAAWTPTPFALLLKPLTAFKASKKVVHDEDLTGTWAQLSVAKTGFLAAIEAAGWPKEHCAAVSSFFYAIENHPSRMNHDDYEDIILVMYQAR